MIIVVFLSLTSVNREVISECGTGERKQDDFLERIDIFEEVQLASCTSKSFQVHASAITCSISY